MATHVTHFNPSQLATLAEAREVADKLSTGPIVVGGGVKPETKYAATSGIYVPEWLAGPTGFTAPADLGDPATDEDDAFYLHFRFNNGAEGMNVGLVREQFRRYPTSLLYVLKGLADEAAALAPPPKRKRR